MYTLHNYDNLIVITELQVTDVQVRSLTNFSYFSTYIVNKSVSIEHIALQHIELYAYMYSVCVHDQTTNTTDI